MNAAPALKEGNVTQIPEIEFAQIEPTTRCNFTCGFCCGRSMEQRDITLETFAKTLDAFPNLKHVELQGEGEPLLHHDFFEMARMLRSRDVSVSIITNGSQLLKRNAIPQILDLGLEKVSVSIESADAETFKKIRGGKLETVVAGIRELIQERNRRGLARPLVDFAVTVLESTVDTFPGIVKLYQELGMDGGINTQLLQRMESYATNYKSDMQDQLVTIGSAERFKEARRKGEEIVGAPAKIGFYKELYKGVETTRNICPWLEKGIFVTNLGDYSPCCKVKNAPKYGYGNVDDDSKERFYNTRQLMREQLHRGEVPTACVGCGGAEQFRGKPDAVGLELLGAR